MKKVAFKILFISLCIITFTSFSFANGDNKNKINPDEVKLIKQNGSTRSGDTIELAAYSDGINTIEIYVDGYTGNILVHVFGGRTSMQRSIYISELESGIIDISTLRNATYNISIEVDGEVYEGTFNKVSSIGR